MKYLELFDILSTYGKSEISFPFIHKDGEDYIDCIDRLFHVYQDAINKLDSNDIKILNACLDGIPSYHKRIKQCDIVRDVNDIVHMLHDTIVYHFKGDPISAYELFEKFFLKDGKYFILFCPQIPDYPDFTLYRMRTEKYSSPGELFHIPFDKRSKVSPERFSILGYPILYLGKSFYICWEELNIPDINNITVSLFKPKRHLNLVDLTFPVDVSCPWMAYSFFIFYPLIMASMVRVKNPDDPFKPEYCIPQDFLTFIKHHGKVNDTMIDGIMYMSSKVKENATISNSGFNNILLLTNNTDQKEGYCSDLANKLQMSDPFTIPQNCLADVKNHLEIPTAPFNIQKFIDGIKFHDIDTSGHSLKLV